MSLVRSCTPDGGEHVTDTPITRNSGGPQKEPLTRERAMFRLKVLGSDILSLSSRTNDVQFADSVLIVLEEMARELRTWKHASRSRRAVAETPTKNPPTSSPKPSKVVATTKEEPQLAQDTSAPKPVVALRVANRSYAAACRGIVAPVVVPHSRGENSPMKRSPEPRVSPTRVVTPTKRSVHHDPGSAIEDDVVARRQASAQRGIEKRAQAELRRKENVDEILRKGDLNEERIQMAKIRREEEDDGLETKIEQKLDRAQRNAENAVNEIVEKAARESAKVDEVLFAKMLRDENHANELEDRERQHEAVLEQRKQQQQLAIKKRNETISAVIERGKEVSQLKAEKLQQSLIEKEERRQRVQETKRMESETKHHRVEEREKKVAEMQQKALEEAEAKIKATTQKLEQSQQIREQHKAELKKRLEKREQKLRETKERRELAEVSPHAKTSIQEALPAKSEPEQATVQCKLTKVVVQSAKSGKNFIEQYQAENKSSEKTLQKSKLRSIVHKLASNANSVQQRSALHEFDSFQSWTPDDHAALRYYGGIDAIVKIAKDARKAKDTTTYRLCIDVLERLLDAPTESAKHIEYFVRGGHLVSIISIIHEEIGVLKRQNISSLTKLFSIAHLSLSFVLFDKRALGVLQQTVHLLEISDLTDYCLAVVSTATEASDADCLLQCLLILHDEAAAGLVNRLPQEKLQKFFENIFTVINSFVKPNGQPLTTVLPPKVTSCFFVALRTLNYITRGCLASVQTLLKTTLALEGFHAMSGLLTYVLNNDTALDRIESVAANELDSPSFADALRFGITIQEIKRPSETTASHLRAMLHELILFMGYVPFGNGELQNFFSYGHVPLIQLLCSLPIQYFAQCRHVLFPTLVNIASGHTANKEVLLRELSTDNIAAFLRDEIAHLNAKHPLKKASSKPLDRQTSSSSLTEPAPAPAKKPLSWADMMEEDDGVPFESPLMTVPFPPTSAAPENGEKTDPAASEVLGALPKRRLRPLVRYTEFFRIERRCNRDELETAQRFFETNQ